MPISVPRTEHSLLGVAVPPRTLPAAPPTMPISNRLAGALIFTTGLATGLAVRSVIRNADAQPAASQAPLTGEEQNVIRIARQITPAVVSIVVPNYGSGSGAVIRRDGMILTNAHV